VALRAQARISAGKNIRRKAKQASDWVVSELPQRGPSDMTADGGADFIADPSGEPENMNACIDACTECRTICLRNVRACAQAQRRELKVDHVGALLDCVTLCGTSVD